MKRQSCDTCREGIRCRQCRSILLPLPSQLAARDIALMLALIDGSDRKYAPEVLDTVQDVFGFKSRSSAKDALWRLRLKLRRLRDHSARTEDKAEQADGSLPDDPVDARSEIRRRALAGEISWDEALRLTAALG